jgi:hypothetical protein
VNMPVNPAVTQWDGNQTKHWAEADCGIHSPGKSQTLQLKTQLAVVGSVTWIAEVPALQMFNLATMPGTACLCTEHQPVVHHRGQRAVTSVPTS